jgi:hypothetical protein
MIFLTFTLLFFTIAVLQIEGYALYLRYLAFSAEIARLFGTTQAIFTNPKIERAEQRCRHQLI